MPYAETIRPTPPSWLRVLNNSRLVISRNGQALLIDCGLKKNWEQVRAWRAQGVFSQLTAIYITHYHDDHTDCAQAAAEEFGAEVWSSQEQAEILREPARFRMPCLTGNAISSLRPWQDAEQRTWNEFRLQSFHFPGQTLYHGALLVEPEVGERVLFVGDSFTPSGLDDYCLLNRNLLGPRQGYLYCLDVLKRFPDALLVNQHVDPLFRFSAAQRSFMQRALEQRAHLTASLTALPGANFAVDEQWFRLDPYVQRVQAGSTFTLRAHIWNHSATTQKFLLRLHLPTGWSAPRSVLVQTLRSGAAAGLEFTVRPPHTHQGLHVLTASIQFGGWDLRHWAEAIAEVF